MFTSIIETVTASLTLEEAVLCTLAALGLGFVIALFYGKKGESSKNYLLTLVVLPALVEVIIMLVNGNLGTGVAIMGAFSLVRFRSMPGSAKEITGIFFSMVVGVACGMGYLGYAALITAIVGIVLLLLDRIPMWEAGDHEKALKIMIPENLDYTEAFDDILEEFTRTWKLNKVKTTNMGSMYELSYSVTMKDLSREKEMIDAIRTRNGNLTIVCGRPVTGQEAL